MNTLEPLDRAIDAAAVQRVFGTPFERNGVTVIPAANLKVHGGGGGGEGRKSGATGEGGGSGYALRARPSGVFAVRGDKVRWIPAFDLNRAILGGQLVAMLAIVAFRLLAPRRRWRFA
jgi:uncharacterized spore protein YtfJ